MPTTITDAKMMRSFFFSYVLMKIGPMGRGLLDNEQKQRLSLAIKSLQALMQDEDKFDAFMRLDEGGAHNRVEQIVGGDSDIISIFTRAYKQTLNPDQNLLVRNRFVRLLNKRVEQEPVGSIMREALGGCVKYMDESMIDASVIRRAVSDALSSMKARYHQGVPSVDSVCAILYPILDEARSQQCANQNVHIAPDSFSLSRLRALKVN